MKKKTLKVSPYGHTIIKQGKEEIYIDRSTLESFLQKHISTLVALQIAKDSLESMSNISKKSKML